MSASPQPPPPGPGPARGAREAVAPSPRGGAASDERVRTFTRLTITGPARSVDVAVPDDLSVAELVRTVVEEMGEPGDVGWVLEHPVRGLARRGATPASLGLRDGERLALRRDAAGAARRSVDEVSEAVAAEVDAGATWTPRHGRLLAATLLGAWPVAAAGVGSLALAPSERPFVAVVAVLVLVATVVAARGAPDARVPAILAGALVVGTGLAGALLAGGAEGGALWVAVGLLAGVEVSAVLVALALPGLPGLRSWLRPVAIGAAVPLVAGLTGGALAAMGMGVSQRLAAMCVLALVLLAAATNLILGTAGVGALDTQALAGDDVSVARVAGRVAVARRDLLALLAGISSVAAVVATALTRHGPWGAALGALVLLLVAARARGYAWPGHVAALAVPPLLGVEVAALVAAARGGDGLLAPLLVLGAVPLSSAALWRIRAVDASRVRLWGDRIETLLAVAVLPVALAVFDVYGAVYERFR